MRVAMYYNNNDVRVEEMPTPQVGAGELLVRIEASGICGSDLMEWYRVHKAPMVLGHEIAGVVVAVGEGVESWKEGDRISASHHVPCNECRHCLRGNHTVCETLRRTNFDPGGFAEFVRVPAINVRQGVYLLPDEVTFDEATFIEPIACVLRGQRRAGLQPGDSVLVIGSGISGLLHIALARARGAGFIAATDVADFRLAAARRFGADVTFNADENLSERFRELNNGFLADRVIVCTGAESAIQQAFNTIERGGTILLFAPTNRGVTVPLSVNDLFWRNDVTITTSYAGSPSDHLEALELIRGRRVPVSEMITHRLTLDETGLGFRLVVRAQDSIKVIIHPNRTVASR
ncbi:MAG: alcohol dehydrogenase catalytic domain-containing protein [bacterium]